MTLLSILVYAGIIFGIIFCVTGSVIMVYEEKHYDHEE